MEAYLALRGLRTLPVRLARQQDTAMLLARKLASHPAVTRVRYPGLPTHPHHQRARAQMRGFGAIVSFEVADARAADLLTAALELIVGGTSLGGVETTIDCRNRWPGEEHIPRDCCASASASNTPTTSGQTSTTRSPAHHPASSHMLRNARVIRRQPGHGRPAAGHANELKRAGHSALRQNSRSASCCRRTPAGR
jgi:hypothetical protein